MFNQTVPEFLEWGDEVYIPGSSLIPAQDFSVSGHLADQHSRAGEIWTLTLEDSQGDLHDYRVAKDSPVSYARDRDDQEVFNEDCPECLEGRCTFPDGYWYCLCCGQVDGFPG